MAGTALMQSEQTQRTPSSAASLSGSTIIRQLNAGPIDVRGEPFRLLLCFDDLFTAGGDDLRLNFECSARVADGRSDRVMLAETLLSGGKESATTADVAAHLTRIATSTIAAHIANEPASDWLTPARHDALTTFVSQRVDAAAFASGLQTMAPFSLELRSDAVERRHREEQQRVQAESRNADRIEHLRRAAELLKEFQQLRTMAGNESAGAVLQRLSPADRGAMLEATLLAGQTKRATRPLWAVAGASLFRIDVEGSTATPETIALPDALGPLRSVQPGELNGRAVALVGAQSGLWIVDPEGRLSPRSFSTSSGASNFGFNAAFIDGDTLIASHAEHGVISWTVDESDTPTSQVIAALPNVRHLLSLGGRRFIFSSASTDGSQSLLHLVTLDSVDSRKSLTLASIRSIAGIVADGSKLFVVGDDGTRVTIDRHSFGVIATEPRSGGRVLMAAGLPWLGSVRLLMSRDGGAIECVGPDDQLVTQFCSVHQSTRIVAASDDLVAAVSGDRQRLILWHAWDGRMPFAEINLTTLARHRIADIDFA